STTILSFSGGGLVGDLIPTTWELVMTIPFSANHPLPSPPPSEEKNLINTADFLTRSTVCVEICVGIIRGGFCITAWPVFNSTFVCSLSFALAALLFSISLSFSVPPFSVEESFFSSDCVEVGASNRDALGRSAPALVLLA